MNSEMAETRKNFAKAGKGWQTVKDEFGGTSIGSSHLATKRKDEKNNHHESKETIKRT